MEEPSVLDYILSKLLSWRKDVVEISLEDEDSDDVEQDVEGKIVYEERQVQDTVLDEEVLETPSLSSSHSIQEDSAGVEIVEQEKEVLSEEYQKEGKISDEKITIPWPVILAALLALIGQSALEKPDRDPVLSIGLYVIGFLLIFWAVFSGRFTVLKTPLVRAGSFSLNFRRLPLFISIPFILLAFLTFGGNRFNSVNLLFWVLGFVFMLWAVWMPSASWAEVKNKIGRFLRYPTVTLKLSPWLLMLTAIMLLSVFFRFYLLDEVPGEMFSDHAEKLWDVADVLDGQTSIFFPRNTGREAFQMYLTAAVSIVFQTGLSFMSLKIGTALAGFLTLPFIYLLGKELGNRWVGLFALFMAGVAYWPNVISRVGLRFTLYPFFTAPTLYFLIRGLRTKNRNDFIFSGIFLGVGLHGYSSFRFVPIVVVIGILLYLLHQQSKGNRKETIFALGILVVVSFVIFLPLFRYALEDPKMFSYRVMSRMGQAERPYPGPVLQIFFDNLWSSYIMPFWDNGGIWVHSIVGRPALDYVSAAFYFIGTVFVIIRYAKERSWLDLFMLVSIPILMMPSILSLAFPDENPSLNRTGGAFIPIFIIAAIGMEGVLSGLAARGQSKIGKYAAVFSGLLLLVLMSAKNYDLVFNQFGLQFKRGAWNTSDIGEVIRAYADSVGDPDTAYVLPYPHWVDTRLVGIRAGFPNKDYALWPEHLEETLSEARTKLFIVKPDDEEGLQKLMDVYPDGVLTLYKVSGLEGKDFYIYLVPAENWLAPQEKIIVP